MNIVILFFPVPQDALEYAEKNGMFFIETSAKTADNINQLFEVHINKDSTTIVFTFYVSKCNYACLWRMLTLHLFLLVTFLGLICFLLACIINSVTLVFFLFLTVAKSHATSSDKHPSTFTRISCCGDISFVELLFAFFFFLLYSRRLRRGCRGHHPHPDYFAY